MNIEDVNKLYRLTGDYHTHTKYSHGKFRIRHAKGTILENVEAAYLKGLNTIAITDHGPGHIGYGITMDELPDMYEDLADAKKHFPDMNILLGLEANIIDTPNGLDVKKSDIGLFNFINAGYHFGIMKGHPVENKLNSFRGYPTTARQRLLVKNTDMALRAIYENPVKIITHPGDKGPFDIDAIAKACEDRGTWMEINTHHAHLSKDEIKVAEKYDVRFVVSSDAHSPSHVGDCSNAILRAYESGLDMNRIVNVERVE